MPGEIYEKVSATTYKLIGRCKNGRLVRATTPQTLTVAQALPQAARVPTPPPIARPPVPQAALLTFDAPDTLGRVLALRSTPGQVAEYGCAPLQARRLVTAGSREVYAPAVSTLDGVVAFQRSQGMRPADDPLATLRTMAVVQACERCHRVSCDCPPSAPQTLALVVNRQAARAAEKEQAAVAAGCAPIRKVIGMGL